MKRTTLIGGVLAASLWAMPALADWGGGGELVIASLQDNQSMQAQTAYKEINSVGIRNMLETLTYLDPDTGQLSPMLATSWEQVEPNLWRFELRQGVTFHDGSPFNAETAAIAVEWVWSRENNYMIRGLAGTDFTAHAVGDYTLEIRTVERPVLKSSAAKRVVDNPRT